MGYKSCMLEARHDGYTLSLVTHSGSEFYLYVDDLSHAIFLAQCAMGV